MKGLKEIYWEHWYNYLNRQDPKNELTFMNYGYSNGTQVPLNPEQEENRYSIQLYDLVTKSLPEELEEKHMLEIGSGRGGGAAYIHDTFRPFTFTGVDLCSAAVDFCNKTHKLKENKNERPNLRFHQGDGMDLDFQDNSYDSAINVESSHRYSDMPKFLSEVHRVLKKGGYFSWADFRAKEKIPELKKQMKESGMKIIEEEDITNGILTGLTLDNERKLGLIDKMIPKILHKPAREFACVLGSASYNSLANRQREYWRFLLQK